MEMNRENPVSNIVSEEVDPHVMEIQSSASSSSSSAALTSSVESNSVVIDPNLEQAFGPEMFGSIPAPSIELCEYIQDLGAHICTTKPKRKKFLRSMHPSALACSAMLIQNFASALLEPVASDILSESNEDYSSSQQRRPLIPPQQQAVTGQPRVKPLSASNGDNRKRPSTIRKVRFPSRIPHHHLSPAVMTSATATHTMPSVPVHMTDAMPSVAVVAPSESSAPTSASESPPSLVPQPPVEHQMKPTNVPQPQPQHTQPPPDSFPDYTQLTFPFT